MDKLTPAAKAIGSINTVFMEFPNGTDQSPVFVGHNTDMLGVRNGLLRSLHQENAEHKGIPERTDETSTVFPPGSSYSFIIGGGGALSIRTLLLMVR